MTFDEFSKAIQWLNDNIGSFLLVITNILAILTAIQQWWTKQKLTKIAQAVVQGVEDYSKDEVKNTNVGIKRSIQKIAIEHGIDSDLKSLIAQTIKKTK